MITKDPVYP